MSSIKPHFDIHPSVVYQLGETLITDAVQALIELVKNSYDADATYAKVTIDTKGNLEIPGAIYPPAGGRIVVEDDGYGMGIADIESGWLMISNRKKGELKKAKGTTPGGRTPLGDKGLGRLGVQRLGDNLEIYTKSRQEPGYHIGFSWMDFATARTIQEVEIHLDTVDYLANSGTRVVISELRDIDAWSGQAAVRKLEQELSRMISPYKEIRNFFVTVEVDGKSLELREITEKIREIAPVQYRISFDGAKFVVEGRARLSLFSPSSYKEAEQFSLLAESDEGQSLYDFLKSQKNANAIALTRPRSKNWFVEFRWERALEDFDKIEPDIKRKGRLANPGPFRGEVDSFDLGPVAFQRQSVFDRIGEFRKHIKELSGIRVYRDGFAIRVDKDWLKLGEQWTTAPSYYGLKPDNTLGYISLTARDNMDLEETTDREGFSDTPYYRNFYILLSEFKKFTTIAHEFFGRAWADYRNKRSEEIARIDQNKTIEDVSRTIRAGLTRTISYRSNLGLLQGRLEAVANESRTVVSKLKKVNAVTPQLREQAFAALSSLEPIATQATKTLGEISIYLEQADSLNALGEVLESRVTKLRRQMDDMYGSIALGLTAEALSHEVFNIADHIANRIKAIQKRIRSEGINNSIVLTFIEYVNSAVSALRKQMSFMSPMLRNVREQKVEINIADLLSELSEFYGERLGKNKIEIAIRQIQNEKLEIMTNKGKIVQIIDNLVLNSEYWLREDISQKRLQQGTIIFEISRPFLRIFDNGRGIDHSVEYSLFEPFVSAKANGRGLGLFVVKQLLDSEGCTIGVLPERNKHNRLYKFQVDFRGMINE